MSDIVFIKDENEYNKLSENGRTRKLLITKIKFICSNCNKESIKPYRSLKYPFLCKSCTNKLAQLRPEVKNKKKITNLKLYGVENCFQSKEKQEKIKQTCLLKYGVENPHQSKEIIEKTKETCKIKYNGPAPFCSDKIKNKLKETCLLKYGVENPRQSKEIIEKTKETCKIKYNVSNPAKTEEVHEKMKNTCLLKYGSLTYQTSEEYKEKIKEKYNSFLKNYNITYIDSKNNLRYFKCNKCLREFSYSKNYNITQMVLNKNGKICPYCYIPIYISNEEIELYNFIKNNYIGEILRNNRTILNGKELDIYLPDLKMGFEFDGTYWHADPRIYCATDIIAGNLATHVWENDYKKTQMCKKLDITLIRIKEYDWINFNENEKERILELLNK